MNGLRLICVLIVITISVGSAFMLPNAAFACSCSEAGSVLEMKDRSDAVFEGMATSVKQSSFSLFRSPAKAVKTSFQVNEVWKGHVAPTMEVHTAAGSDSCGFEFQEGERYLVYARSTGSALEVSLCSGTILHGTAFEHVAALGSGSIPPQPAETIQQSSGLPWRFILLFSAIGCSLTIMFVFRKKQRKSKSKT